MTRNLSGPKLNVKLSGTYQNTLTDLAVVSITQPTLNYSKTLTGGVSANQANRVWESKNRTLADTYQEIIDLYDFTGVDIGAGAGKDALGLDIIMEEVIAIAIVNENLVTEDGQLEIFPSASNGWQAIGSHTVANGGALLGQGCLFKSNVAENGFNVEKDEGSRITLRASGGSVTYSIYILGRSDDEESSSSSSSTSSMSTSSTSGSSSSSSSRSSISTSSTSSSSTSISTSSISTSSISTSSSSTSSVSSKSSSSSCVSVSSLSSSSTSSQSSMSQSSVSSNSSSSQSESSSSISVSSIS